MKDDTRDHPMTVANLIEKLQKLPNDAPVFCAIGSDEYGFSRLKPWSVTYSDRDGQLGIYLG